MVKRNSNEGRLVTFTCITVCAIAFGIYKYINNSRLSKQVYSDSNLNKNKDKPLSIKQLWHRGQYDIILKTYPVNAIINNIYDIFNNETNKINKFRAILFLTMLDSDEIDKEVMKSFNKTAGEILEDCVNSEYFERYQNTVSPIKTADFYRLLGVDISEFDSAFKLGIDECIKGNFTWAKNIFKSCRSIDNYELMDLIILYYQYEIFENTVLYVDYNPKIKSCFTNNEFKNFNLKNFKRILNISSKKYFLLISKILDKYGLLNEQIKYLEELNNHEEVVIQDIVINLIKQNKLSDAEKYIDNWITKVTNINFICVMFEFYILTKNDVRLNQMLDIFIFKGKNRDIHNLELQDCRLYVSAFLVLEYFNSVHTILLEKAIALDPLYYKTYILLGNATKQNKFYEKAIEVATNKTERVNAIRILLVTKVQDSILQCKQ